jgi:hypothetical protein
MARAHSRFVIIAAIACLVCGGAGMAFAQTSAASASQAAASSTLTMSVEAESLDGAFPGTMFLHGEVRVTGSDPVSYYPRLVIPRESR